MARRAGAVAAVALAVAAAACGGPAPRPPAASAPATAVPTTPGGSTAPSTAPSSAAPSSAAPSSTGPSSTAPSSTAPGATAPARRLLVVLDAGHNGGNATHYAQVSRPVDAGNGRRKPCNEVGAETDTGYPEHAFAWDVVVRTRALLAAGGIDVRLTRPDDTGVGPCVDVRGRYGNGLRADAVVSVHADGSAPGGSGFHVIEAARTPGGAAVARSGHRLALAVRAALRAGSGLDYADYIAGGDGLDVRDDLAGLNLATRPSVLVECGNMHNPGDAALITSPAGRQRIAAALATGIRTYLGR